MRGPSLAENDGRMVLEDEAALVEACGCVSDLSEEFL